MAGLVLITEEVQHASLAARLGRWLAHFAFVLLVTATVAHRFLGLDTPAYVAVGAMVPMIAITAIIFGFLGLGRFWIDDVPGIGMSVWAIFLSASLLVPYGWLGWQASTTPMLHDIATDLIDPPQLESAERERAGDFMNPVLPFTAEQRRQIATAYPQVHARRYARPAADVEAKVAELIAEYGWTPYPPAPVPEDWPERTFEARAKTLIAGYPIDVAVRVIDEGDGAFVDMRSSSVYGRHDLGDNAARIAGFLDDLDRRVNEIVLAPAAEEAEAR